MLLFSGAAVNLEVWGHSHTWPAPATSTTLRNLSNSRNNIFYRLTMAIPKWCPIGYIVLFVLNTSYLRYST